MMKRELTISGRAALRVCKGGMSEEPMGSEDFGSEGKEINGKRFVSGRGTRRGGGLEEEGTEEGTVAQGE